MANNNEYISLRGDAYIDAIAAATGKAKGRARWVGNIPVGGFSLNPQSEPYKHFETSSGKDRTDLIINRKQVAMVTVQLENINKENLILSLFGKGYDKAGATAVANEAHLAFEGYSFTLNRSNITTFTSLTSNPSGTTYVRDTDYSVNLKTGRVTAITGGALDDADGTAVLANYTAGASTVVTGFSSIDEDVNFRFEGVNTAKSNAPFIFEAFKVRFQPGTGFDLLTDEVVSITLEGEIQYEPLLDGVADFDGMFRMIYA